MESGRFLLAVVLMIATVVIVNVLFPPLRRGRGQVTSDSTFVADSLPRADSLGAGAADPRPATPTPVPDQPTRPTITATPPAGPATAVDTVVVESPLYRYGFSTRGAALVSAEMLEHQSFRREGAVQLAPETERGLLHHQVRVGNETIDFSTINFQPDRRSDLVLRDSGQAGTLRFTGVDARGRQISVSYAFVPDNFLIDVRVNMPGVGRAGELLLNLGPTLAINEANRVEDRRSLAYVVNSRQEGITSVPLDQVAKGGQRIEEGPLFWVAVKNKYFVLAALPAIDAEVPGFGGLIAQSDPEHQRFAADLTATLLMGTDETASYQVFAGPQEYDRLDAMQRQLEDVNPYGWRWLRPVIRPLGHAFTFMLLEAHRATGLGYGWVLILFGVAVRLALWPLNTKAMRSQMKGMELQPRIKDIQTRCKDKPELMQKQMIQLYREEGFNPMGGCLPLLLPMPVLITLFFVFQSTIEFRGVSWLWLPDLSRADPLYILPALLGITMWIQQWLSMKSMPPNPQAKMMLWFMPAFMVFLFLNFASGLNLYYAAQNFTGFPQQLKLIAERKEQLARKGMGTAR